MPQPLTFFPLPLTDLFAFIIPFHQATASSLPESEMQKGPYESI